MVSVEAEASDFRMVEDVEPRKKAEGKGGQHGSLTFGACPKVKFSFLSLIFHA